MKEKYIKIKDLSVSKKLVNFINGKLLAGTKISKEQFWRGFNKYVHELSPKNKNLLEKREKLQKTIDTWHKDKKDSQFNLKKYTEFLKKIGYLKKSGCKEKNFIRKIQSKN